MGDLDSTLVIGGCRGLEFHLVIQLLQSGEAADATVPDIDIKRSRVEGARYVKDSVTSYEDVSSVLADVKPRAIFHLALPHAMYQSATPKLFDEVNVYGTENLLDCIYEHGGVKVLIYTPTTGVIHDGYTDNTYVNATEDVPIIPNHPKFYIRTKAQAEVMFLEANWKHGLLTCALRGPTFYGEGDNTTIPQIVRNAQAGREKMQVGDDQNMFDYLYLGNAAYAHRLGANKLLQVDVKALPPAEDERIDSEVFVITNDEPWKFWDFVRAVGTAAGCGVRKEDVKVVPTWVYYAMADIVEWRVWLFTFGREESQMNREMVRFFRVTNTFDISKARARIGYHPQWTIQEGIDKFLHTFPQSQEGKKSL